MNATLIFQREHIVVNTHTGRVTVRIFENAIVLSDLYAHDKTAINFAITVVYRYSTDSEVRLVL